MARLKSSVAMSIRRQERGLAVAQRTNHLVFAGPPGTGKTTIARVVAKIYCGLGLLKKETVREVHRADLPLSCPLPSMALWNSHPRVYLPIEADGGEADCPYCGAHFVLVD